MSRAREVFSAFFGRYPFCFSASAGFRGGGSFFSRRSLRSQNSADNEHDQGLLGFRQQETLLFYRVAPFGAVFSSHWPRGTDIPVDSTLLSARRKSLHSQADLRLVPISSHRMWLRIADPSSSRWKLSEPSKEMLHFLGVALASESAADAFGEGSACGVGGWLRLDASRCFWFSERSCPADFRSLGIR